MPMRLTNASQNKPKDVAVILLASKLKGINGSEVYCVYNK